MIVWAKDTLEAGDVGRHSQLSDIVVVITGYVGRRGVGVAQLSGSNPFEVAGKRSLHQQLCARGCSDTAVQQQ